MTIWDTTSESGGSGSGASWSDGSAGGGYEIQSALVPSDFIGSNIEKVWFYLKTNVTSTTPDAIHCYIIDSSGSTRATSANSVSRADITTAFVLHEFSFDVTVAIADTDNIVVGFSGASGGGSLQFDGAPNNSAIRTFAGYSPATLYGTWSGQYRFKVEYEGSGPSGDGVLLPPPYSEIVI